MNYYRIAHTLGRTYPQCYEAITDYNYHDEKSSLKLYFEKDDGSYLWPSPILNKGSKKTDLISASTTLSSRLIISEKLKIILESGKSEGIQFIPTTLFMKNLQSEDYWIVNYYEDGLTFFDVPNSQICLVSSMLIELETLNFRSREEYLQFFRNNKARGGTDQFKPFVISQIAIEENCDLDFFSLMPLKGAGKFIISENIKLKIEEAKCTGIRFKELNDIGY